MSWKSVIKRGLASTGIGRQLAIRFSALARLASGSPGLVRRLLAVAPVSVPLAASVGLMGFPFGPRGWHHLVELLKEYSHDPHLRLYDSVLYRFHQRFQPASMAEALLPLDSGVGFRPPLGVLPWGAFQLDPVALGIENKDWWRSRFCGPSPLDVIQEEFESACAVYASLRDGGYDPWRHSFIGGTFLRRRDGALRFVVLQGNHRMAALAHLGYRFALVRRLPRHYVLIADNEVEHWQHVRSGLCTVEEAQRYFNAYFDLSGFEQAHRFGLIEHARA
jgi:hypothetical protein